MSKLVVKFNYGYGRFDTQAGWRGWDLGYSEVEDGFNAGWRAGKKYREAQDRG